MEEQFIVTGAIAGLAAAVALVPAWFGISHLVAAQMGYRGCPEIGAIPSALLARRVATGCGPWERIDGFLE